MLRRTKPPAEQGGKEVADSSIHPLVWEQAGQRNLSLEGEVPPGAALIPPVPSADDPVFIGCIRVCRLTGCGRPYPAILGCGRAKGQFGPKRSELSGIAGPPAPGKKVEPPPRCLSTFPDARRVQRRAPEHEPQDTEPAPLHLRRVPLWHPRSADAEKPSSDFPGRGTKLFPTRRTIRWLAQSIRSALCKCRVVVPVNSPPELTVGP